MNILTGIRNFLQFINDNWTVIIIIIALIITIVKKAISFFNKSDKEKIDIAKKQIQQTVLKLVTDAEEDYQEWVDAGAIKRSQVIKKIFEMYPILSKATNQEELVSWIDNVIDESLETMRNIFEEQKGDAEDTETNVDLDTESNE